MIYVSVGGEEGIVAQSAERGAYIKRYAKVTKTHK